MVGFLTQFTILSTFYQVFLKFIIILWTEILNYNENKTSLMFSKSFFLKKNNLQNLKPQIIYLNLSKFLKGFNIRIVHINLKIFSLT